MNWQHIKDDWPRLRRSAQERWPRLAEGELEQAAGNRTVLMQALQEEYGWTLEHAGVEVDRWADTVSEHGVSENEVPESAAPEAEGSNE